MPYKDPEDKRRWEQKHREQRNARRREKHLRTQSPPSPVVMPDPVPDKEATSGWKILASIAAGIGIVLLSAVAGASQFNSATHGSGSPGQNGGQ